MTTREEAARARRQGGVRLHNRPRQRRAFEADDWRGLALGGVPTVQWKALLSEQRADAEPDDAPPTPHVIGLASRTETPYTMYDFFGPYTEIVSADAFDKTLSASPLVEFTLNHNRGGGLPMAHTRNDTLTLTVSEDGFEYDAEVDDSRTDVADMLKAMQRGDLAESSFKFMIVRGSWSPDYEEYRIAEVDLDRGDVSAVNFGANPYTSSGVRSIVVPRPVVIEPPRRSRFLL